MIGIDEADFEVNLLYLYFNILEFLLALRSIHFILKLSGYYILQTVSSVISLLVLDDNLCLAPSWYRNACYGMCDEFPSNCAIPINLIG